MKFKYISYLLVFAVSACMGESRLSDNDSTDINAFVNYFNEKTSENISVKPKMAAIIGAAEGGSVRVNDEYFEVYRYILKDSAKAFNDKTMGKQTCFSQGHFIFCSSKSLSEKLTKVLKEF